MNATWTTKYGERRVRHDPPTLEDALFAAQGMMLEGQEQIRFAAELMQVPVEDIQARAEQWIRNQANNRASDRAGQTRAILVGREARTVIVERRTTRHIGDRRSPKS